MAGKAIAVDVGSHSTKVIEVKAGKHGVAITGFGIAPAAEGPRGVAALGLPLKGVVSGLAGREMTLRYHRVPPTPDAQLRNLMDLEIQDLASQSGGGLSADFNLLPAAEDGEGDDTVLLALAKDEALEARNDFLKSAGGSVAGYVPNCIALYNAFLKCGPVDEDESVCLVNVGHDTIDVAIVRGVDLLFARNLTGGGKVLDDAIGKAFNVSERKAESLKRDLIDLDPASRGRYASGQAEKVTVAAGGAASVIASAIQSSLAFCKTQTGVTDLTLDKVLLCGGSARLRGVRGMLREAVRCPVELFDPFDACDTSALSDADATELGAAKYEAVVALGLAVGQLDDSLYALEILPESVRKRKQFTERTIFNIVAVLVGVGLLAMTWRNAKEAAAIDDSQASALTGVVRRAQSAERQAERLIAENAMRRAVVDFLSQRSVPMDGSIRVLRALRDTATPAVWLDSLEILPASRRRRNDGADLGPVIQVEGRVKELGGVVPDETYNPFYSAFRQHPLLAEADVKVDTPQPERPNELPFVFRVAFPTTPDAESGEDN